MNEQTTIPWHEAPVGATHYNEKLGFPWLKSGPFPQYFDDRHGWCHYGSDVAGRSHIEGAKPRPQTFELARPDTWNGEGLPPVGTLLEFVRDNGRVMWQVGECVGHHDELAVLWDVERHDYVGRLLGELRPIKTAERIAAEERAKAIGEMADALGVSLNPKVNASMGKLYDAGYRKAGAQ